MKSICSLFSPGKEAHLKAVLFYPRMTPHTEFPTWEPLQLLFLGRVLRDNNIDFEIIDGRIFPDSEREKIVKQKLSGDTVCFGMTSLTCYQLIDALAVAHFVKEHFPEIPVVLGGWHATIFPEESLKEEEIDIVVRGQGEVTFLEVIERLMSKRDLRGVKGVSWKRDGRIFHEDDRPLVSPDKLPPLMPADFERLDLGFYQLNKKFFYMSSVGCPYACKYCCISLACKRKWIPLSSERVIQELEGLKTRFGFKEVIFWDNVFFTDRKRVEEICTQFIQKNISLSWSAHGRINEIIKWDDTFIRLLKESGCKSVFIGAESGSQDILDRIDKKIRDVDILPSFRKLKKHDIDVAVNWMVGLPAETHTDVVKTVKCIKEGVRSYDYNIDKFKVYLYRFVPFPGTPIFNELGKEEMDRFPKSARAWGTFIHEHIRDGFEPWKEENGPSKFASSTFYLWKAYLQEVGPGSFAGRILKKASKLRVKTGFFKFPLEWLMWKKRYK